MELRAPLPLVENFNCYYSQCDKLNITKERDSIILHFTKRCFAYVVIVTKQPMNACLFKLYA